MENCRHVVSSDLVALGGAKLTFHSTHRLVNALVNTPDDLEERMMLRAEFSRRGLNEAMAVSRPVSSVAEL